MIKPGDVYKVRKGLHYVVHHETTQMGMPVFYMHVYGGDGIALKRAERDISRYNLVGRNFKLKG